MKSDFKIYDNVKMGKNCKIGDGVIIGLPPRGYLPGELQTVIGDNAEIRANTIIYAGNKIGDYFQSGHNVTIRENNIIWDNVSIGTGSCIEHKIKIESNVRIHSQAFIPEFSILKENCWIGPNVVFTNALYPKSIHVKDKLIGPTIMPNAIVGANSTILTGVTVGKDSIIGAGSVVVKDVGEDEVVVGNPAKKIKMKSDIDDYINGGK